MGLCDFLFRRRLAWGHPDHRLWCTCLLPLSVDTEVGRGRSAAQGLRNLREVLVAVEPGSPGLEVHVAVEPGSPGLEVQ